MRHLSLDSFWNYGRARDDEYRTLSDDQLYELQVVLDEMTEPELRRFKAAPENQTLLKGYKAYVRRRMVPYGVSLAFAFALSIIAGTLAAW